MIYETLKALEIQFKELTHPPLFTTAEAMQYYQTTPGFKAKSLFLRNRKGNQHYLVVVGDEKKVDLKRLSSILGESQVGFASPERLWKYLQVRPGSVSPLGLVYDAERDIKVIIDSAILEHELVNFHPNDNTKTLTFSREDLMRYLGHTQHASQVVTIPQ